MTFYCRKCCFDVPSSEFLFWKDGSRQTRCYRCVVGRAIRRSESRVVAKGGRVQCFTVQKLWAFWERSGISPTDCFYCGVWLMGLEPSQVTIEHLHPICDGGAHSMKNLVPCCEACNLAAAQMGLTAPM